MHDTFRMFRSEKRDSVVKFEAWRAFFLEGSFNKINKFMFNQIMV